jgi:hypothetical protein
MESNRFYRTQADKLRRRASALTDAPAAASIRGLANRYEAMADARAARAWIFMSLERRAFGGCGERASELYHARAEELRAISDDLDDGFTRTSLRQAADGYEKMARKLARAC